MAIADRRAVFVPKVAPVQRRTRALPVNFVPTLSSTEAGTTLSSELNVVKASEWLGGRDSNPDNRVQSAVSYR